MCHPQETTAPYGVPRKGCLAGGMLRIAYSKVGELGDWGGGGVIYHVCVSHNDKRIGQCCNVRSRHLWRLRRRRHSGI